jgi:hypothetical protein
MPVMVIVALLSFAVPDLVDKGTHVDQKDGQHSKCLKPAPEKNGLCRQYEIKR